MTPAALGRLMTCAAVGALVASTVLPTVPASAAQGGRAQTIDIAFLPDLPVGQTAVPSATASSGLPVEFSVTGACVLSDAGANPVVRATRDGTCIVEASQAGDSVYAATPAATETFTFLTAEVNVTSALVGSPVLQPGQALPFGVTVAGEDGNVPAPSGSVFATFDGPLAPDGGIPAAQATLDAKGHADLIAPASVTSTLTTGGWSLYVNYPGGGGYLSGRATPIALTVRPSAALVTAAIQAPPQGSPVDRFIDRFRPIRGYSYEPSPSNWAPGGVNFDSDYYNADFAELWGPSGRDDLGKMAGVDINFLHIYNWNPQRDHLPFLNYARQKNMGITVPISNYTHCLMVGGCQGIAVAAGSYQAGYDNIRKIFEQVYLPGDDTKPHGAAAIWGIWNEYDKFDITPDEAVFAISAILDLERKHNVPADQQLPFFVSTSTGPYGEAPNGIGATKAIASALKASAMSDAPRSWVGRDGKAVVLDPIPDGFWQRRYVASTNPFQNATAISAIILQQWPAAFPGGDKWSDLPPMFFGEMGFNAKASGPPAPTEAQYQSTGDKIRDALRCSHPVAAKSASPGGYFLGESMFEFSQEDKNGWWGVNAFTEPPQFTTGSTTTGQPYRVDTLVQEPTWDSIRIGMHALVETCPTR